MDRNLPLILDDDEWATEMRAGLEQEQFAVHYQPKVDATTGRVTGFEALARWSHPERGPISPDRFIALAEANGTIEALTAFVVSRAIDDCAGWTAAGFDGTVAVNIAASLLTSSQLLDRLTRVSRQHSFDLSRVVVEVTESAAMSQPHLTMELLGRLRLHGVSLSLDDFGTGFSNLARLHQMPFNELKIDKRFVIDAASSRDSQVIVRALVGLAGSLGLTSVAEGVENADVWAWLRTVGVDQLQGFGIARPMPANSVLNWLRDFVPPPLCVQAREVA